MPVTSCLPSPSRALRVEQTHPAACPATGWLRPRSWRSPRQLGVTRTRTQRPNAQPSPESPGPLSGPTTSPLLWRLVLSGDTAQSNQTPLSAPRTAQPTPAGSQVPRESGRKKKNLLFTGPERPQLGFASLFLRFLFSRFLRLKGKGWQSVDPPGQGVGVVQGNPSSWKGPPTAGETRLESVTTWPRAQRPQRTR